MTNEYGCSGDVHLMIASSVLLNIFLSILDFSV